MTGRKTSLESFLTPERKPPTWRGGRRFGGRPTSRSQGDRDCLLFETVACLTAYITQELLQSNFLRQFYCDTLYRHPPGTCESARQKIDRLRRGAFLPRTLLA